MDENAAVTKPIPMRLFCEVCHEIHIDEGDFATKPHHTHACQCCGAVWRPALVPTVGVRFLPGFKNDRTCKGDFDVEAITKHAQGLASSVDADHDRFATDLLNKKLAGRTHRPLTESELRKYERDGLERDGITVDEFRQKKIARNMSTAESRAFWESAERIAAEVDQWPDSKRAGINVTQFRKQPRDY